LKVLAEIADGIFRGNANLVKEKVLQALDAEVLPLTILKEGLIPGLNITGESFKNQEIFVPHLLLSVRAINMGIKTLEPLLKREAMPTIGKVVVGTVEGDLHDIGKSLVCFMLKSNNFEVIDIGYDVSKEKFVQAVVEHKPDILAMSALLTTTMPEFAAVIRALVKAGLRNKVKIMVGGAPVSRSFAEKINADAYVPDAVAAVEIARGFIK
jgi:5-methyltetrahydrofolate--homocysteine methyltransferase